MRLAIMEQPIEHGREHILPDPGRSVAEQRPKVFHQQEEVAGVGGTGLEVESLVPGAGLVVLGVHKQRTDAGDVRGLRRAKQSVFEERLAEPSPLLGLVDG
jgi:hypothetical protein